jgi:hypothetical protein
MRSSGRSRLPEDIRVALSLLAVGCAAMALSDAVAKLNGLSCRVGGDLAVREFDLDAGAAEVDHCDQGVG